MLYTVGMYKQELDQMLAEHKEWLKPTQAVAKRFEFHGNLTNADLTNAYLKNANLTGADLTGADLTYVDLTDADLTNAKIKLGNREVTL